MIVTKEPTRLAATWCVFLEAHARKIYAPELYPGVEAANSLVEKIKQGAVIDGQSTREIYQHHWSGLTNAAQVSGAVEVLISSGWVRLETVETTGRYAEVIRLHPNLRGGEQTGNLGEIT